MSTLHKGPRVRDTSRDYSEANPRHSPSPSLYKKDENEILHFELQISMEKTAQKLRTIHLFCPSLSTIAPFLASDDHRIDIGSIATIFGLEPSSLKLNGHFLSRGLDLVSSVTWKSLLSFFSAKRLPIGSSDLDALVVDGKLSKIGVKSEFSSFSSSFGVCFGFSFLIVDDSVFLGFWFSVCILRKLKLNIRCLFLKKKTICLLGCDLFFLFVSLLRSS